MRKVPGLSNQKDKRDNPGTIQEPEQPPRMILTPRQKQLFASLQKSYLKDPDRPPWIEYLREARRQATASAASGEGHPRAIGDILQRAIDIDTIIKKHEKETQPQTIKTA